MEVNVKEVDVSTRKIDSKDCNRLPEVFKVAVEVEALPGEREVATKVVATKKQKMNLIQQDERTSSAIILEDTERGYGVSKLHRFQRVEFVGQRWISVQG